VRIVGGRMRGTALTSVGDGDVAAHLRPTSDRVRESVFNLLLNGGYGNPVQDARVLDLFAGTGALGLEALSRGAGHVTFVDNGKPAQRLILANIARCRAEDQTKLIRRDVLRPGACPDAAHDLVFLDPPYGSDLGALALAAALTSGWIAPGALVVWEDDRPPALPLGLVQMDQRRYGGTVITIAERARDVA